jgi:hydroxymethylpyrimidine pyrophosphatase-like HAD family hydrolase
MRFHALACDYDGTLALQGRVDAPTVSALERLRATGRQLILVTGRELDELLSIFPQVHLFTRIVAENGALLYRPDTREIRMLCRPPDAGFVAVLRRLGVQPLAVGRAIVATWKPHEQAVLATVRELGLDLQVIFNKEAVMVLPPGVTKASGLEAALEEMQLTLHETVAVGDAENDLVLFAACEAGVAVANALPAVKERADWVTPADHGAGVIQLIDALIVDELAEVRRRLTRHHLLLGRERDGREVRVSPARGAVLIAGPSASGKSTAATSFLERLEASRYQFVLIDPEGDYEHLKGTITLRPSAKGSITDDVLQTLEGGSNVVVNLVGMALADRPPLFLALLPHLLEARARTGRPHWLVVDEAHHLLPVSWEPGSEILPRELQRVLYITVHPNQLARAALAHVDTVLAVGDNPEETIGQFCTVQQETPPDLEPSTGRKGEVVIWSRTERFARRMVVEPCHLERRRHTRKYAEGQLPPERSFFFRGPAGRLNLRAQNLFLFLQIGEGVDEETWAYHLQNGDFADWFRTRIKDDRLAVETEALAAKRPDVAVGRQLLRELIERYYTLPATTPLPMPGTDAEIKDRP